jgi:hypothetical protein
MWKGIYESHDGSNGKLNISTPSVHATVCGAVRHNHDMQSGHQATCSGHHHLDDLILSKKVAGRSFTSHAACVTPARRSLLPVL